MHTNNTVLGDGLDVMVATKENLSVKEVISQEIGNIETVKDDLDLNEIYTPLAVAKEEVWNRWNDTELRKKVEKFLGGDIPEVFMNAPRAMLARQVMSPNFELERFDELSKAIGLQPLHLEYSQDKFSAKNIDKYYTCKLYFHYGEDNHNLCTVKTVKVVDFGNKEGVRMCDIQTMWGENLVDFHHRLLKHSTVSSIENYNISDFCKRNGGTAEKYYTYFFVWFLCYGVLFENYLTDNLQKDFTHDIVLQSYEKVSKLFGIKPLIVHLGPDEDEENLYWRYYPASLMEKVIE